MRAVDRFAEFSTVSDQEAAKILLELGIDVLVDLNGHTLGARPGILARRVAAVQAQYMGFAGTMGADFIDYIIADGIVLPFDQQQFYREKIVHLPDTYWACDTRQQHPFKQRQRITIYTQSLCIGPVPGFGRNPCVPFALACCWRSVPLRPYSS